MAKTRTSKKKYQDFKEAFLRWKLVFGLVEYDVLFDQKDIDGTYAQVDIDPVGCVASVIVAQYDPDPRDDWSESTALHEVLHLAVARIKYTSKKRFVSEDEIDREEEKLVRTLEHVIMAGH